ncbi:MAG: 16S rRNA (uracil(1498)-N(3))-methyltransferase [Paracoccaceae bacterium]
MSEKIRLYVDADLGAGQSVALSRDQAHYLFGVMRQTVGGAVTLFNGRDGAWRAEIAQAGKRNGVLICDMVTAPLAMPPDLWLFFAPIKKARTDFIVEKAVEMGAMKIAPVITEHTNSDRVRTDRLQAHAVEAAEQCGATFVPQVAEAVRLRAVLDDWDPTRRILFADEGRAGASCAIPGDLGGPWAILIGPEGGFSTWERTKILNMPQTVPIALGPRILRADTAAVAAMALWQSSLGDWGGGSS